MQIWLRKRKPESDFFSLCYFGYILLSFLLRHMLMHPVILWRLQVLPSSPAIQSSMQ